MKTIAIIFVAIIVFFCACTGERDSNKTSMEDTTNHEPALKILCLGDSYTIGEAVPEKERWPNQLSEALTEADYNPNVPVIIAKTGWTTAELIEGIQSTDQKGLFDLVTLLIGVNNQYRGQDTAVYRAELNLLMQTALKFAGKNPGRVLIISIPDYGVTPFAQNSDPESISAEIEAFNSINSNEAKRFGFLYIDITPVSRLAKTDTTLLAEDGLHPSARMYKLWVDKMLPMVKDMLNKEVLINGKNEI